MAGDTFSRRPAAQPPFESLCAAYKFHHTIRHNDEMLESTAARIATTAGVVGGVDKVGVVPGINLGQVERRRPHECWPRRIDRSRLRDWSARRAILIGTLRWPYHVVLQRNNGHPDFNLT